MAAITALMMAATVAFAVTVVLGFTVIPWLRKLEMGEFIAETTEKNGLNRHIPPVTGGVIPIIGFFAAVIVTVVTEKLTGGDITSSGSLVASEMYTKFWSGLIMAASFGFTGFIDDYLKSIKHQNLGFTFRQKTFIQTLIAIAYLISLYMGMNGSPYMFLPFVGAVDMGSFYWIFGLAVIYSTVNAASLTNGVDGLCNCVTFVTALSLAVIAYMKGLFGFSLISAALAGACIGFFPWNKYPSKARIGSAGSVFSGAMTVAIAFSIGCPIIIYIAGAAYTLEGVCFVAYIVYYKVTGKQLFKRVPFNRHLEICGYAAKKISAIWVLINIFGGVAAIALMYFGGYTVK